MSKTHRHERTEDRQAVRALRAASKPIYLFESWENSASVETQVTARHRAFLAVRNGDANVIALARKHNDVALLAVAS